MTHTKTFRVFVSSTFSDFKAERNALQEKVYPRLRELCQQHECRFQAIDLRWGISEEAALDQQAMNICIEELRQCQRITPRPNFIVLLGQRYGWCPLPPQIDAVEFETLLNALPLNAQQHIRQWYIRDHNAVPADYSLQPRSGLYKEIKNWSVEEQKLRALLHQAIHSVGWALDDPRRLKYEASATHQEIFHGALQVKDCNEHVFGFFRTIEGIDQDDMTGEYFDLDPQGRPDQEARERLNKLQKEMCARLPGNIHTYSTTWLNNAPNDIHFTQFCDDVYNRLSCVIEAEVKLWKLSDPVDHEALAHKMFGKVLAQVFVGRRKILQSIQQYLDGQLLNPLVVHGVSGSGKSALMAKIVANYELRATHYEVIVRYIGTTPSSTDVRSLLEGLCKEITLRYDGDITTIPVDYKQLVLEFPNRLALATAERPILLILDSLDQLSETDNGRDFSWLPVRIDKHVKMIVTTLPGECLQMLEQQMDSLLSPRTTEMTIVSGTIAQQFIEVVPMDNEEGEVLLDEWLKTAGRIMEPWEHPEIEPDFHGERRAGRTLTPEQRKEILSKFGSCSYPLYLKLAYEEARCWKSLEGITTPQIYLAPDTPGVISGFLKRLEDNRNHGWMLTSRTLGYLAASRHGLSEDELLDLLSADAEVLTDCNKRAPHSDSVHRLPVIVWARLFMDLKPYMSQRMVDDVQVISFYHSQVRETVIAEYINNSTEQKLHFKIADMFERDCKDARNNYLPRKRAIGELAYHYRMSDHTKLKEIYANISYFCSYVKCHNAFVLKADIEDPDSCIDGELRSFISNAAALLSKYPEQAPQLIYKELVKEDYRNQARDLAVHPWIRADRIYLENNEKIEGIGILPVLSEESWIQANCVAEKKGVVFIYNSANKIKLLQIDDLKPCGEILLPEQNLRTIKKLLCDTLGHLLALVYDNGEIEVLKTLFSPSGSILSTTIVHRGISKKGKFGAISACSWPDGIVYQTPNQNVICIQLDQVSQNVSTAIAFDNRTLISCNVCNIPYLIWRNDKDYSITFPSIDATIRVDFRPLAVCQNGSRLVIATEEGKLLICRWPDLIIEKDLICRLPIVSTSHTDQGFFIMTDRHGNIWSLDHMLQLVDNGRCSNDFLEDYPSAIYLTGAGAAFYISNRKYAVLSLGEASHRDVMCIDEKGGKRCILAYDRNKGFSVSIGIDAPRPLIQSIVGQQYEFEFSKFKWAWNGNSSIAYTGAAYSVSVDNGIYSFTHAMESEVCAILYIESLEAFLVICYSGQLHSITIEKSVPIPIQSPRSETGNYRIVNCGKYICIVAYNVLCKPSERNAYSETVMTLHHLSVATGQKSAKLIEIEHIDDNRHRPIKHLSYHASSNALYLNRGQTLERWALDEPLKHDTTSSTLPQDYNRYQPICAYENGIFYIDINNQLKFHSMTLDSGGAGLASFRTITFLSPAVKKFGYLIENGQYLYRFTIEE